MALQNRLDTSALTQALSSWLPEILGVRGPVEVTELHIPSASGMSSETVLFEAEFERAGAPIRQGLVARIPPADGGLFAEYDLGKEIRVMSVLTEHTEVPVPRVLAHETSGDVLGAPFALLERAYGAVPGDDPPFVTGGWVVELSPSQRARIYDQALTVLAGIQRVDPVVLELNELWHSGLEGTVIEQDLEYWRRFYTWAAQGRRSPLIEESIQLLADRRPEREGPLVVTWGDARFGNMMFGADQSVTGVFDWEMAGVGRPEVDLGYFLFFDRMYASGLGLPRLDGFPSRPAAIARFEELSGYTVSDLDWFEAWAALRGAILLLRVGNQLIELGLLPDDAPMPISNPASHVLAALLGLPAPTTEAGWISGHR